MLILNYSLVIEIALKSQTNWQIEKYKKEAWSITQEHTNNLSGSIT